MGTRGFRVVRFRKRYYIFFNQFDSYPDGLGKQVAAQIPADAKEYQQWLDAQRKSAEKWEALYEDFLSIKPGNQVTTDIPDFMHQHYPSLLAPLNDTWIEWIYTMDLDREVFSVDNGAHFKLDRVPHIDWINSLADGDLGDKISLPGAVPIEALSNLVVEPNLDNGELSGTLDDLSISDTAVPVHQVVVPKDIKDIPWRQRHGPILRGLVFYLWSHANEDLLAATLLQLSPEDLPFREIAYAALCLASGGKNVDVFSSSNVSANAAFGFVHEGPAHDAGSEFISVLASGAHLQGFPPGSSPEATVYWHDNVLIVLTAQLYRAGAVDEGIAHIVRYCQKNHSAEYVDAVLISVEHVVLVHVTPGGMVQHTAIMPLFDIKNHLTMSVNDRYAKRYLEKLAAKDDKFMEMEAKKRRKADQERMLKNEGTKISYGDDDDDEEVSDGEEESALRATQVEGNINSTFYALVHLFEAAACKRMPPARVADGLLPNELYTQIIKHVTDMKTRESLTKVSRTFRRLCQEDILFVEGLILEPSNACQSCDEAEDVPKWFEEYDIATGTRSQVRFKRAGGFLDSGDVSWKVAIGSEYSKRSLLPAVAFRFATV